MLTFQRILEPASKLKNFEREERYFGKYNLSPARMIDSLNAVSGVHLQQNHYMFDYYDKMVECKCVDLTPKHSCRNKIPTDEVPGSLGYGARCCSEANHTDYSIHFNELNCFC